MFCSKKMKNYSFNLIKFCSASFGAFGFNETDNSVFFLFCFKQITVIWTDRVSKVFY